MKKAIGIVLVLAWIMTTVNFISPAEPKPDFHEAVKAYTLPEPTPHDLKTPSHAHIDNSSVSYQYSGTSGITSSLNRYDRDIAQARREYEQTPSEWNRQRIITAIEDKERFMERASSF